MDIYLSDIATGDRIRIPMLPEKINIRRGNIFESYVFIGRGAVEIPLGEEITSFFWDGIFPGEARGREPYIRQWIEPLKLETLLETWRVKNTTLRLLVTETNINHDVYIAKFDGIWEKSYGDFRYDIVLQQAKELVVKVIVPVTLPTLAMARAFVTQLYRGALGREPDPSGLDNWVNQLLNGATGSAVAYGFFFSREKAGQNLSNTQCVEALYRGMLGREPEPSGRAHWLNLLNSGTSRESVFNSFAASPEFDGYCKRHGIPTGNTRRALPATPAQTLEVSAPRPAPPPARTHTVVRGNTLWGIAQKYYGKGSRWPEIYDANKSVIGSNPNIIIPGQVLTIP